MLSSAKPRPLAAILAALCLLIGARAALAQTTVLDPWYVVVQTPQQSTFLRSGAGFAWYEIATLKEGTILRADGREAEFIRVNYPKDTLALVPLRHGNISEDGNTFTLRTASALFAYNTRRPTQSFRRVFVDELRKPGEQLIVKDALRDDRDNLDGYLVVAPEGAKGFVLEADTRPATPEEVRAFLAPTTPQPKPGNTPEPKPQTKPETTPEATPTPTPNTPSAPATIADGEGVLGDDLPAPSQVADPDATTPETTPGDDAIPGKVQDVILLVRQLEAAYNEVASQSIEEAELEPLLAEYRRLITLTKDLPDPGAVADHANRRIALLQARRDLQDLLARTEEIERGIDAVSERFELINEALRATRVYDVTGYVAPSALYNGVRLPLMYRLLDKQTGGRTLAYILPSKDINLDQLLQVRVGVRGEEQGRAGQRVPILKPVQVNRITADQAMPQPTPPVEPSTPIDGPATN